MQERACRDAAGEADEDDDEEEADELGEREVLFEADLQGDLVSRCSLPL